MAYGGSQARSVIGAVAAGLHHSHSNLGSIHACSLHHSSWQHRILNPVNKARDRTHNLMVLSRIRFRCTTMGTPKIPHFYNVYMMCEMHP